MAALAAGIEIADEFMLLSPNIAHIAFFSDNAAATTAILDPKPRQLSFSP